MPVGLRMEVIRNIAASGLGEVDTEADGSGLAG
jgi:hypothetical protein